MTLPLVSDLDGSSFPVTSADKAGGRLPSLDGWRAVAILMVLGHHSSFSIGFPPKYRTLFEIFDGPLGVSFFFTVSGFLITWLLLQEQRRAGRVRLSAFYIRRALRILPLYAALLATVWALQTFGAYHQSRRVWLANLTFTTNFLPEMPWPTGHLWSLAVEEQFYLLWPGLLVLLGLASDLRRALIVLLVPILGAPLFRVLTYLYLRTTHFNSPILSGLLTECSFFNHADQLAFGCVGAFLLAKRRSTLEAWLGRPRMGRLLVLVSLIVIPEVLARFFRLS